MYTEYYCRSVYHHFEFVSYPHYVLPSPSPIFGASKHIDRGQTRIIRKVL